MSEWQPIETAPKEGAFIVWLDAVDGVMHSRVAVMSVHPNINVINGQFTFDMPNPTHWMPLPTPPETTNAQT